MVEFNSVFHFLNSHFDTFVVIFFPLLLCNELHVSLFQVYESNHESSVMAGLIQGPCAVLPPTKFQENNERRSRLETEANTVLQPVFICKYVSLSHTFLASPCSLLSIAWEKLYDVSTYLWGGDRHGFFFSCYCNPINIWHKIFKTFFVSSFFFHFYIHHKWRAVRWNSEGILTTVVSCVEVLREFFWNV